MHNGAWRGTFENDSFLFTDGNYTAGFKLDWVSAEVSRYPQGALPRRLLGVGTFLPGLGDPGQEHYVALGIGQLIFTPEDINQTIPARDDHPYAGILFLDTAFIAFGNDVLTSYKLMLGIVGESSGAENVQEFLHDINNLAEPRGWSHQLSEEPVINVGFERHVRSLFGSAGEDFEWDIAPNLGLSAGTFFTGMNVGARGRFGSRLPLEFGRMSPRTAFESPVIPLERPSRELGWFVFCAVDLYAVARYLPVDGNAFRDSVDTERENFVAGTELGFTLHRGPLAASIAYTLLSDTYSGQDLTAQGVVISLVFFPQ